MIAKLATVLSKGPETPLQTDGTLPAAVLLLLYKREGAYHLLFTRRTRLVEHHKGQISFPGGALDPKDHTLAETALRETAEELGIDSSKVRVLGRLSDLPTISRFMVRPYVGIISHPFELHPNAHEVAEVIEVPLQALLSKESFSTEPRLFEGKPVPSYSYEFQGNVIWGATAKILGEFLDLIRRVDSNPDEIGTATERRTSESSG